MSEKNMQVVRRLLEEVWTKGNLSLLPDLVAEKAESRPMPNFDTLYGPEEYRNFIAVYKGAFHDMTFNIEDQFGSGRQGGYPLDHPGDRRGGRCRVGHANRRGTHHRRYHHHSP